MKSGMFVGLAAIAIAVLLAPAARATDAPRLAGAWIVDRDLRAARNVDSKAGYTDRQVWRFAPNCDEGPCSSILTRRLPDGAAVRLLVRRIGDRYVGVDRYLRAGDCDGRDTPRLFHMAATYTLQITASENGWATRFRGSLVIRGHRSRRRCPHDDGRQVSTYERYSLVGEA